MVVVSARISDRWVLDRIRAGHCAELGKLIRSADEKTITNWPPNIRSNTNRHAEWFRCRHNGMRKIDSEPERWRTPPQSVTDRREMMRSTANSEQNVPVA